VRIRSARGSEEDHRRVDRIGRTGSGQQRARGTSGHLVDRAHVHRAQQTRECGLPPATVPPHLRNHHRVRSQLDAVLLRHRSRASIARSLRSTATNTPASRTNALTGQ
jgi:hypothetical protein